MEKKQAYQHWQLTVENDVLWLAIDRAAKAVNALHRDVLNELDQILDNITAENYRGVIIYSTKPTGFIAGADIEQFTQLETAEQATELLQQGQSVFLKLANLSIPTVAMIEGFCLGGGYELALACRYRVAEESTQTKIGLPEVKLGIHPGWGGCVRLPKLIGAPKAMQVILSGRIYSGKQAAKMGMVDVAVPKRELQRAAKFYIENAPQPQQASLLSKMANQAWVRPILAKWFHYQLSKKVNIKHYPAPFAVIDIWKQQSGNDMQALEAEVASISQLIVGETAQNLVRVFFLQEKMKGLAKGIKFKPQHIHVIGAGVMGGDIAAWCALQGLHVTLQDLEPASIAPAVKRAHQLFARKLKQPHLIQTAMDRLVPDPKGHGIDKADLILEAIVEDLELKRNLFQKVEQLAKKEAVLATNTSSIPIKDIASVLNNPQRLVGIHFFNPVAKMMLIEVVKGKQTDTSVVKQALAFVKQLGKLPLPVEDSPGFLVNRVLMPYLMEAFTLSTEGVPLALIDQAAMNFGMPMGPIELADNVGLDVCLHVANNLSQHFAQEVPGILKEKVAKGELGRKTQQGFYTYRKGKVVKPRVPKTAQPAEELALRLIYRMLNEAAACLREGVIDDADLLDAGMIFGTGFAPFRGGPMHYVHQLGVAEFTQQMQHLAQHYGERFHLDQQWQQVA
jgi:3-hydroxyacyl-CoA dehydrogenase/enoyl-CoA hydratase/3-hydroxybutyryl-CoA epimerase